jgi:DNA-binding response OmpR family regulator
MPNKDGLEAIIELRRTAPRLPIIAMSGQRAAGRLLTVAQKLGAIHTLQKPFLTDELLAAVATALRPQT